MMRGSRYVDKHLKECSATKTETQEKRKKKADYVFMYERLTEKLNET